MLPYLFPTTLRPSFLFVDMIPGCLLQQNWSPKHCRSWHIILSLLFLKAAKKSFVVKLLTSSKCTAMVTIQKKMQKDPFRAAVELFGIIVLN